MAAGDVWGNAWGAAWGTSWRTAVAAPAATTGYGGGWDFDFGSLAKRIEDERRDRDDRRAELERLYRKATGKDLQDVAQVKPAAEAIREAPKPKPDRVRAIEGALVQLQAIADIERSIAMLEQQSEEADIVWIVSNYV